jgi:hypothetical protein
MIAQSTSFLVLRISQGLFLVKTYRHQALKNHEKRGSLKGKANSWTINLK